MAFTEFCCRSGGSNLNAGTRTGNSTEPGTAADLTYASGTWVSATGVFTVASGDPSADGVAVGDYASVYADGATVTTLVGRVTARTTTTITVSTTAKSGTTTDGTSNRTLKIGGAWQGPNGAVAFPFNFLNTSPSNAAGDPPRLNLKGGSNYSITAAIVTTVGPRYCSGYTTSYGDRGRWTLDGGTTGASYVLLTYVVSNNNGIFSDCIMQNNGATGSAAGAVLFSGATAVVRGFVYGVVVNNVRGNGLAAPQAISCEAYACNQSNTATGWGIAAHVAENCISHDNTGSNSSGFLVGGGLLAIHCIADSNGQHGFNGNGARNMHLSHCDAYNNAGDGVLGDTSSAVILNCNLVKNGGFGINSSGAALVLIRNCGFGSGSQANASGQTGVITTTVAVGSVTYASGVTPWADPANGDFRISLAAAKGTGNGEFTQTAASYAGTVGYPDIGAAQSAASGSSGIPIARGMHGGMR